MRLEVTLPLPPSANACFRNAPGIGRVKTEAYRTWAKGAMPECLRVRRGVAGKGYRLHLVLPANMRGDLDNRIKPTQDLLVKGGVLPDDRHAASIMAERGTHTEPFVICIIEWSESP